MKNNMPTQPVHDLVIHPRESDLIVATHGRGFFITDISPLEELNDKVLATDLHLFDVRPQVKWVTRRENVAASTNYNGPSRPNGIVVNYYQRAAVNGDIVIQVLEGTRVIAETKGPNAPGLNQVLWNMRWTPMTLVEQKPEARGGRSPGAGRFGQQEQPAIPTFGGTVPADPGEYTIVVTAGSKTLARKVQILEDVWFDKMF
jgi:hypothetical protein